jgi:hypothetical protein
MKVTRPDNTTTSLPIHMWIVDLEALDGITAIRPSKVTLRQFDLASRLASQDPLYDGIDLLQPYSVR